MLSSNDKLPRSFGDEYDNHIIFDEIKIIQDFYEALSYCNISFIENAAFMSDAKIFSTSTYIYSSIEGTFESISVLLHNGRCNDAFALVRKYCDSIVLDIYKNILSKQIDKEYYESLTSEAIKNNKIKQWIDAESRLFEEREIINVYKTIKQEYPELTKVFNLTDKSTLYHKLREICNDNMHYNYLYTMMANDASMIRSRKDLWMPLLKSMARAIRLFFSIHFSFIYVGNPGNMMSSDYMDYLDCGMQPPPGCERWVPNPVQIAFSSIIQKYTPKISKYLLSLDLMDLE